MAWSAPIDSALRIDSAAFSGPMVKIVTSASCPAARCASAISRPSSMAYSSSSLMSPSTDARSKVESAAFSLRSAAVSGTCLTQTTIFIGDTGLHAVLATFGGGRCSHTDCQTLAGAQAPGRESMLPVGSYRLFAQRPDDRYRDVGDRRYPAHSVVETPRRGGAQLPRVTVIGIGYLGLTHAVCLADLGHDVLAIDIDEDKIARAASGETPFFEPGLEPLLRKNLDAGRLRFTTSFAEVGAFGEVHFLCVGTPQGADGEADLSFVHAAAGTLAPYLTAPCLIAGKSTVPVGTARQVLSRVRAAAPAGRHVDLAWNPEFLREGHAVADSLTPDRIVLGVTSGRAEALLREVYATPLEGGVPLLVMDLETAELVKVAANAFLATKISFINAMAEVCEAAGADVLPLADALGYDARIGRRFLSPGLGYGGGCLPKDVRAFRATATALGVESLASLLGTVDAINTGRRDQVAALASHAAGGSLDGTRVAVLGAAFKPNSDDVRDSPSLAVCDRLRDRGAVVSVHDPVAMPNAAKQRPDLRYARSVFEAAQDADLVLHLTEWADYQAIDPAALAQVVARRVVIDARCSLDAGLWADAGWTVRVLGRPLLSVVEVADAGEVEADPGGLRGGDGQVVTDRAARL